MRILNYPVTAAHEGTSITHLLRFYGCSRHVIRHLKGTENGILCNGRPAHTNQLLKRNDTVTIRISEPAAPEHVLPVALPISIVYEDADIIVLNKPAGMPIHPSPGNYHNTLANGIAHYFAAQNQPHVFRCINRLDRDTTGLLILAKHMLSGAILSLMMKERRISRTYLALVAGRPKNQGTINAPIGRKSGSIIERCIDYENGAFAVTHYKLLKTNQKYSLVQLQLETGRTHQIRVHMNAIGHPLLGDTLYHSPTPLLDRQGLHSHQLTFRHPITKEPLRFTCPLPVDMAHPIRSEFGELHPHADIY